MQIGCGGDRTRANQSNCSYSVILLRLGSERIAASKRSEVGSQKDLLANCNARFDLQLRRLSGLNQARSLAKSTRYLVTIVLTSPLSSSEETTSRISCRRLRRR